MKNYYALYPVLLIIEMLLILFTKPVRYLPDSKAFLLIGFLLLLIGVIINIYWELFWSKNFSSKKIITKGIYGYIRHPLLLALMLIFFGIAVFFNSFQGLLIAILSAMIIFIGSKKEEKELIRKHGKQYKEYMKKVSYRFVPKVV